MTKRQFPRPKDLLPLVRFKKPDFNAKRRRLRAALTIEDLRLIAKRRTPRAAFDYTEGAAEAELSLARARQAFKDIEFHPAILRDVSQLDTGWDVLGRRSELPFGIAPTGFTRMMHTEGERAGAGAAAAAGIPFALSTMGTTPIEDVAEAGGPDGRNWFQLYMWKDRDRSMALVDRAAAAGFDTLLVTVDVPVAGARLRDKRNGFAIPPELTARTVFDMARHPNWWFDMLTTEPLAFASLSRWSGTVADLLNTMFDPTVDYADLAWIKEQWPGKLVVKGVQTVADAKRLADMGVDGITLSNHGGRQLDSAPAIIDLVAPVADAVGDRIEIICDGGVRRGSDIVKAVALGARACMAGRAYLYGLGAAGERGVDHVLSMFDADVRWIMALIGAHDVAALTRELVSVPTPR